MRETNNLGRIAVHTLLILCLTSTLAAQTQWKKYEEPDGNFSVLFPGEPKDTVSPSREGIGSSHAFYANEGSVYVGVFYASMKQEQRVDEDNYEAYKKGTFSQFRNCKELNSTVASPAFSGYIGHGYRLECEGQNAKGQNVSGTLVLNLYLGKHFLYAVTAGSAIRPDPPTVKQFMDSFSVTDVGK